MTIRSTVWARDPVWNAEVDVMDYRELGWRGLARRWMECGPDDVVVVQGALGFEQRWRDLVIASAARGVGRRPRLVVSDATWAPRSLPEETGRPALWKAAAWTTRALARRVGGADTVFCFLSHGEVADFTAATGLRARFTPFVTQLPSDWSPPGRGVDGAGGPFVFSGGNSLRDHDLLCEALADIGVPVRVATARTDRRWPANFEAGPVPEERFFDLCATATVGALALRSDVVRSVGQQTYLNLLALGTPVVVNDAPGVREHLGGVPGAWIAGSAAELRERVLHCLDPVEAPAVASVTAEGSEVVAERYSPAAYLARLLAIARELEEER